MTTQIAPSVPVHATVPLSSTPPAKLAPTCHLDPSSYVKGRHQLTIEANAIIHPRTYLFTELGPLTIRQGTIVTEKCVIGRREKNEASHSRAQPSIATSRPMSIAESPVNAVETSQDLTIDHNDRVELPEIVIGPNAYLHAAVIVQAPCTVSDSVVLEPGVVLFPGCTIGPHSKVCAGITLPPGTNIPEWTVVYGMNGSMRRRRVNDGAEDARLDLLKRERASLDTLLRSAARNLVVTTGASGPVKSKRESMIRG